jgi:ribosomal protein L14E/L6E/L27E
MTQGQIVIVKMGKEKGLPMVVLAQDGGFALLVDGKRRLISNPKKKSAKHLQPTNFIVDLVPECGRGLQDADIRKHLAAFAGRG